MDDHRKTKAKLIEELSVLRAKNQKLEAKVNQNPQGVADLETSSSDIFSAVSVMAWCLDCDKRLSFANSFATETLGRLITLGQHISIYSGNNSAEYSRYDDDVLSTGNSIGGSVERYTTRIGENRWFVTNRSPRRDDDGKISGVMVVSMDLTNRVQAELTSARKAIDFERLVTYIPECFWSVDIAEDGTYNVRYVSPAWERMWGFKPEDIYEDPNLWLSVIVDEDREIATAAFDRAIADKERQVADYRVVSNATGEVRYIEDIMVPIVDGNGAVIGLDGVARDQTYRKKLAEELQKAQKLESLGILAGGIAHDFNNLLTGISGYTSLVLSNLDSNDPNGELLEKVLKTIDKTTRLTTQLLTFASGGEPVRNMVSSSKVIEEAIEFAMHGSKATCQFELAEDLLNMHVDEGNIAQVINNLIINACQAMPEGGQITVRAENATDRDRQSPILRAGRFVKLSITDQGIGIDEAQLGKVFDPFFTTKEKGNGLGLAIAYSIVSNHNGHINIESKVGKGTTVSLWLPGTQEGVPAIIKIESKTMKLRGKVLIMDDEQYIRDLGTRIFEKLEWTVETATNGTEAIEKTRKAKQDDTPFDVAILDLTVPGGMNGKEAMGKMLDIDPSIRGIVSSGYSTDPVMSDYEKFGFKNAVPKPFERDELVNAVYEVMQE